MGVKDEEMKLQHLQKLSVEFDRTVALLIFFFNRAYLIMNLESLFFPVCLFCYDINEYTNFALV